MRQVLLLSSFCRWESWGMEGLGSLSKVMQVLREETRIETQVCLKPNSILSMALDTAFYIFPSPKTMLLNFWMECHGTFNHRLEPKASVLFSFSPFSTLWPFFFFLPWRRNKINRLRCRHCDNRGNKNFRAGKTTVEG